MSLVLALYLKDSDFYNLFVIRMDSNNIVLVLLVFINSNILNYKYKYTSHYIHTDYIFND